MEPVKIALVDLGELLVIDINRLAKKLNSLQKSYLFDTIAPLTITAMGEPDIEGEYYSSERLHKILGSHSRVQSFDYIIGFTHVKIVNPTEPLDQIEKAYFAENDLNRISVISLNRNLLKYNSPTKDNFQFAAYLTVCELLILMSKLDLVHQRNDYCLFDDCVDRNEFGKCIDNSFICETCLSQLSNANVGKLMISDSKRILNWCKKNSLDYAIKESVTHPIASLAIGTGLGWLASLFLTQASTPTVLILMIIVPIGVFIYSRFMRK